MDIELLRAEENSALLLRLAELFKQVPQEVRVSHNTAQLHLFPEKPIKK